MTSRRWAVVMVAVGTLAFVVLAATTLPWHTLPSGIHPVPVRAGDWFSAAELRQADDFARTQRLISLSSYGLSLLLACWLGFTSLGSRLLARLRGWWWVRVLVGTALLTTVGELATLPLRLVLRHRAVEVGLSTQTLAGWLRDDLVALAVAVVSTGIGLVGLIGLVRWLPRAWPLVAGGLASVLVVLGSMVYPILVEPLFSDVTPLPHGTLRSDILRLADREGVSVDTVMVADASRRTTSLNAYVTGLGSTRRVVLYDTSIERLPRPELESIVAHELGHAKHHDVLVGTLLGASGIAVGVGLLGLIVPRLGRRAGVRDLADPRSVALILALIAVAGFAASPIQQGISRRIEARADLTALQTTRDPEAFVAMQRQLVLAAHSQPDPPGITQFWFGSHPTTMQRIGMAESLAPSLNRPTG